MNTATRGSRRGNTQRRQPVTISGPSPLSIQRRRRSRSPDPQPVPQTAQVQNTRKPDAPHTDKRKKPGNPSVPSSSSRPFLVAVDDVNSDRGRKSKVKARSHNRHLTENSPHLGASRVPEIHGSSVIKRESSKSRDSLRLPLKGAGSDVEGSGKDGHDHVDHTGLPSVAEFAFIKRELEALRKAAQEHKKAAKKERKLIDELKQQEYTLRQKLKESESQVLKLQNKTKKVDEAIATVESNSQCQICMELLYRPYALSPCGHILCVTCLQEWFRKAPDVDDEMYDDNDPDYLLRRRKTCPCCRTNVRHRPIPVFMIKAIVAAIAKVKGPVGGASPGREQTSNDSDPWEGLFPEDEEEIDDYGATDEEDEDEDEDIDEDEDSSWYEDVFSYGTGSGEETYEGQYVYPEWEPPSVVIDEEDYLFDQLDENDLNCLRRGVSFGMLREYNVDYSHESGLIAHDEVSNRFYLGWNIRLSADDKDGDLYMQYIVADMTSRPERWRVIEDADGSFDAHRMVPEEDVVDYDDTDSDNYMEIDVDPLD